MQLEDYFDFDQAADRIRIKGTKVPLEHLIADYHEGDAAEVIVHNYAPSLSLEQVHAAFAYYLHNRAEMDAYVERRLTLSEAAYAEHEKKEPSDLVKRLRSSRGIVS